MARYECVHTLVDPSLTAPQPGVGLLGICEWCLNIFIVAIGDDGVRKVSHGWPD